MGNESRKAARVQRVASRRYGRVGMAAACLLSAIAAIRMVSLFAQLPSRATQSDYSIYYASAYLLRLGEDPYTTHLTAVAAALGMHARLPGATDPPTFLLMFEPLAILGPEKAYWTWQALNALALAVSLWM